MVASRAQTHTIINITIRDELQVPCYSNSRKILKGVIDKKYKFHKLLFFVHNLELLRRI